MITPIQIEETKEWLKDLELSCHNHMRGMADCHDIEYYRFKMRAEALAIALEIIEEYKDKEVRMKETIDQNIRLKAMLDKVNVEKIQEVLTGSVTIVEGMTEILSALEEILRRYATAIVKEIKGE